MINWRLLAVCCGLATRPPPFILQGEVSASRIDISARVAGRVTKLHADVGATVGAGAVVIELESPQLEVARLATETAVARADFARIGSTRPETIEARRAELAVADADVKLYQDAYDRQAQLVRSGSTAQARVDEATRNLEADIAELTVRAPASGQVTTRVAEIGGNYGTGAPLLSLIDTARPWFTFNIREDLLAGLKVGDTFRVEIPALDREDIEVRVTVINVQGQYATWRATRATGGFDLKTFEVRAEPVNPVEGLRPGMSVIAQWTDRSR